ncbi:hypothetical protein NQZ79_g3031 [Umbelopsis isabellina]|nr:hypothetical protein NQZ79_g3031 [Umbelopsis isabellina]
MSELVNNIISGFKNIVSFGSEETNSTANNGCCGGNSDGQTACCNSDSASKDVESGGCQANESGCACSGSNEPSNIDHVKIFYSTLTGTAKKFAEQLETQLKSNPGKVNIEKVTVMDIVDYDNDDFMAETAVCIFILSSYNVEGPLDWFSKWTQDLRYDWRVDRLSLQKIRFAVCGLGDSEYGEEFNAASADIDKWFGQLGASRIYPLGSCDKSADQQAQFNSWVSGFISELQDAHSLEFHPSNIAYDSDDEGEEVDDGELNKDIGAGDDNLSGDEMVDVEDMGKMASKIRAAKVNRAEEEEAYDNGKSRAKRSIGNTAEPAAAPAPRDMVSPMLHKNLTKQGYKIVGSHSGVKICRWTKAALRGRGFCYKHSFYGIQSHLCSESTPSLACANKCVFCWRHHTNPVGKTWRWKVDDPEFIVQGVLENHYKMIKQLKGVPGVKAERFQEAFDVKHCALSLVGEPIFYPHINEFIKKLHERRISTFLVTNAQFPEKIAELEQVTQLYVSVDASTKESLKKIDRPLFRDFWERFLSSLDSLATKGQRTVFRLTLVKDYNTDELANYVELIRRGRPSFIEIKGVTYCGYSGASNLTMANVPYHTEVIEFCKKLVEAIGGGYELAAEHAHSCSILIASTDFKIDGEWYTHIDYPKFFELLESGKPFNSLDYVAKTPSWALFGAPEAGFDPNETRFYRKGKNPNQESATEVAVAV